MKKFFEFAAIHCARIVLRLFRIVPVKRNRILFSAYTGRVYACNPKYIFEALYDSGEEYDFVWCINDENLIPSQFGNVSCARYLSLKHLYYLVTSRVIVNNCGIEPILPKRKTQLVINTWHGGGCVQGRESKCAL